MSISNQTLAVLGVPVDPCSMDQVIGEIDQAAMDRRSLLLSTINANFLVQSHASQRFRLSLLVSDICTIDGIGMLLMSKIVAAREKLTRVSGADIMQRLIERRQTPSGRPLRVFFFGGQPGVAERARDKVNALNPRAICCVGALNPGFGDMDELSSPSFIAEINDVEPDFLIVSLGAARGQEWILRNRAALTVPVCAHLGAALNFVAGSVKRAPPAWQAMGLEWLWRIRQEPALAKRYRHDGRMLVQMALLEAVPQAVGALWDAACLGIWPKPFRATAKRRNGVLVLTFSGAALFASHDQRAKLLARALATNLPVVLDCRDVCAIDAAGQGQIIRFQRDMLNRGRLLRVRHSHLSIGHDFEFAQAAVLP